MPEKKPTILISGASTDSKSVAAIMADVRALGAEPILIANHGERLKGKDFAAIRQQAQAELANADGVIIMGNNQDIDPRDYGAASIHKETKAETATSAGKARASYEYILAEEALNAKTPLLGVCAGMQRMNVLCGGTLNQHVPDLVGDDRHQQASAFDAPFVPVEFIQVAKGTTLDGIADGVPGVYAPSRDGSSSGVFMDNSLHHQSVDKIGEGFRASAYSIEVDKPNVRIVEAIEASPDGPYGGQFAVGVQWHPEFGASRLSAQLLNRFTGEAQAYAQSHDHAPAYVLKEAVESMPTAQLDKASQAYAGQPIGKFTAAMSARRQGIENSKSR